MIGAETFSRILDPEDRSGRAIFGDGAGAVVLRAGSRTSRVRSAPSTWGATERAAT